MYILVLSWIFALHNELVKGSWVLRNQQETSKPSNNEGNGLPEFLCSMLSTTKTLQHSNEVLKHHLRGGSRIFGRGGEVKAPKVSTATGTKR